MDREQIERDVYLVRCDGDDVAVVASSFDEAVREACAFLLAENADDPTCDEAWSRSIIQQVVKVGADAVVISAAISARQEQREEPSPWPVRACLVKLADAAEHLLREHDCDDHGYEEVAAAIEAARKHAGVEPSQPQPAGEGPGQDDAVLVERARAFAHSIRAFAKNNPIWKTDAELLDALAARVEELSARPQPDRAAIEREVLDSLIESASLAGLSATTAWLRLKRGEPLR